MGAQVQKSRLMFHYEREGTRERSDGVVVCKIGTCTPLIWKTAACKFFERPKQFMRNQRIHYIPPQSTDIIKSIFLFGDHQKQSDLKLSLLYRL